MPTRSPGASTLPIVACARDRRGLSARERRHQGLGDLATRVARHDPPIATHAMSPWRLLGVLRLDDGCDGPAQGGPMRAVGTGDERPVCGRAVSAAPVSRSCCGRLDQSEAVLHESLGGLVRGRRRAERWSRFAPHVHAPDAITSDAARACSRACSPGGDSPPDQPPSRVPTIRRWPAIIGASSIWNPRSPASRARRSRLPG